MTCQAKTYSDGSWHCERCHISGDKDEPIEDYCEHREREIGKSVKEDKNPSK